MAKTISTFLIAIIVIGSLTVTLSKSEWVEDPLEVTGVDSQKTDFHHHIVKRRAVIKASKGRRISASCIKWGGPCQVNNPNVGRCCPGYHCEPKRGNRKQGECDVDLYF